MVDSCQQWGVNLSQGQWCKGLRYEELLNHAHITNERVQVTSNGGKQGETGVLWLQVEKTGGNLYLNMESATESKVRGGTATAPMHMMVVEHYVHTSVNHLVLVSTTVEG